MTTPPKQRKERKHNDEVSKALLEAIPDLIFRLDKQGTFLNYKAAMEEDLYVPSSEFLNKTAREVLPEKLAGMTMHYIDKTLETNELQIYEYDLTMQGTVKYFEARMVPCARDEVLVIIRNISKRKESEIALRQSEMKYRQLFDQNLAGVFTSTPEGQVLECNQAFARMLGYESPEAIKGIPTWKFYHTRNDRVKFLDILKRNESVRNYEVRLRRRDGSSLWVLESVHYVQSPEGQWLLHGALIDITDRKRAEDQILYDAIHDPLTDLPNKTLLLDRTRNALNRLPRNADRMLAVISLGLDRFQTINESLGDLQGDQILISYARRLQKCLNPDNTLARLRGDEFVILLEDVSTAEHALEFATSLQYEISKPIQIKGSLITTTASIGIALCRNRNEQPGVLLRNSLIALHKSKSRSPGGCTVFDSAMYKETLTSFQLESELRKALDDESFKLVYHPIVDLSDGSIVSVEALVRWDHIERGLILPQEFISLAEDTGLIIGIDLCVIKQALQQMHQWKMKRTSPLPRIYVNLSGLHFSQPYLVHHIDQICEETETQHHNLGIEITENTLLHNPESAVTMLQELRSKDVELLIDDFGTGFSSLSHLSYFDVDTLKIDQSFISMGETDHKNRAIVRSIIDLSRNIGINAIAEGIETEKQLEFLQKMDCRYGQGFLFTEPLSGDEIKELIGSGYRYSI